MFEHKEALELLVGDVILVDNVKHKVTNVFRGQTFNSLQVVWDDGSMEVQKNAQVTVV